MKFISTRGVSGQKATFEAAVLSGYAADGGMLLPETIPQVSAATLKAWTKLGYEELAVQLLRLFIDEEEVPTADLKKLVAAGISKFQGKSPVALESIDANLSVLELWHGPTFAFKDLALSILGQFLNYFLGRRKAHATILVGTSGDTGSAAIHSIRGCPHVDIVVLFPAGRISALQEAQMTTIPDANVHVLGMGGTSDDLDVPIRRVFNDPSFVKAHGVCSINSINVVRILMQCVHIFWSVLRTRKSDTGTVALSIPTGAAGHAVAAVLARKMGCPLSVVCAATNCNDVLHQLVSHGLLSTRSVVQVTSSPSMDIQVPYNVERLLFYLWHGDAARVATAMREFEATGEIHLTPAEISACGTDLGLVTFAASEAQVFGAIRDVWTSKSYLLDPHTAVSVVAAKVHPVLRSITDPIIVAATASPGKFPEAIATALNLGASEATALIAKCYPDIQASLDRTLRAPSKFVAVPKTPGDWAADWTEKLRQLVIDIDLRRTSTARL